jgi:hypothetical protein
MAFRFYVTPTYSDDALKANLAAALRLNDDALKKYRPFDHFHFFATR